MRKRISLALVLCIVMALLVTGCGGSEEADGDAETEYKYYTAEEVKECIEKDEEIILLDIQPEEAWEEHHIKGAIPTHAFPVDTDDDKAKIDEVMPELEGSETPIVIVCPRGRKGAEKTYNYLLEKNIDEDRLYILKDGQEGWPHDELLEK